MKSFTWRFFLCVAPNVLAAIVAWVGVSKYFAGESGGFKLGVDLVGGTILVYEIDLRKSEDTSQQQSFDPVKDIGILADALKKRIDPNDLYNIIIRPAGGEGRVEIVLPTGGTYRSKKADEDWQELLDAVAKEYKITDSKERDTLKVPRGHIFELADAVQLIKSERQWQQKLLANQEAWDRLTKFTEDIVESDPLKRDALVEELRKQNDVEPKSAEYQFGVDLVGTKDWRTDPRGVPPAKTSKGTFAVDEIRALKPGDTAGLVRILNEAMSGTTISTNEGALKNWIKHHAWNRLIKLAKQEWKLLESFEEQVARIPPDNNEQLMGFIQAKGSFIGQAGIFTLESVIGVNPLAYDTEMPEEFKSDKIKEFIEGNYGPSHRAILRGIQARAKEQGRGRDLTVEEVQRIKDLVARVGLLEFRILANGRVDPEAGDDVAGIKAAQDELLSPEQQEALKKNAEQGKPPPGPTDANRRDERNAKEPMAFQITLARGQKSWVSYSWVELSRQQRRELNLDNAAKDDPRRDKNWRATETMIDKTFRLPDGQGGYIFKGALFFKRMCKDRNLNPEERDKKKYEYFILTRDPEFQQDNKGNILEVDGKRLRTPRIDGGYLTNAASGTSQDFRAAVHFAFNSVGANLFGDITGKNVPDEGGAEESQTRRHLAIILDGEVMSAPTIQSKISSHGQISGNFTQKEVEALVNTLRAGRLPATLKPDPVSESTMGPTLGQDTIRAGVISILIAFAAVLAFMVIYYRFAGFVASLALLSNLLLTVGFMTAVQATFTLPGLAGLVLMLGMAVDANILIYERLREERDRGANLALAIRNGYERALPTIIDTHLSSIFTAIVLYIVGNDQLKGFGVSLTVGLIISLFTSLFLTRTMFDFWLSKGWLHKLSMLRFFSKPNIDFMALKNVMFIATATSAVLGFVLFFARAPFNIDFVGGTAYGSNLVKQVSIVELRDLVSESRQQRLLKVEDVKEIAHVKDEAVVPAADTGDKKDKKGPAKAAPVRRSSGKYLVKYASEPVAREIAFLNPPDQLTKEKREEEVKFRAGQLPDASVEQIYLSTKSKDYEPGKSDSFVVRTAEKEPELVQAMLNLLLVDDKEGGKSLLKRAYLRSYFFDGRQVQLSFYNVDPKDKEEKVLVEQQTSGSPLFVKSLFTKELMKALNLTDRREVPPFEIRGDGAASPEGGFVKLIVKFEADYATSATKIKIQDALDATVKRFNESIQPDRLENFDSQLATVTRYRAIWAILASWVAIMIYLWFRFGNWTFGLAAVICLVHDLFITLGFIAVAHYLHGTFIGNMLGLEDFKVDLPCVAALLTLVGYSVNDTIVVFDRIREVRGKNPDLTAKMINDSVNQTLSRTLLASTTTWLVVFVLYVWGGPGVKLFAYVMVVGVIVGTYSSIYIASPLLLIFGEGEKETTPTRGGVPQTQPAV